MRVVLRAGVASVMLVAVGLGRLQSDVAAQANPPAMGVPVYEVEPGWLDLPNDWVLGQVTAVALDAQDNVWVLHRYRTIRPELADRAAPPILQFDPAGQFMRAWGGPGEGYEWPGREHSLAVDHKGNVWIGGEGPGEHHVLKFTPEGQFLLQVGRSGQSQGLADTVNFMGPTDITVWPPTNEAFIGDTDFRGRGGRVVVIDADTGEFKRMWGAYGNTPEMPPAGDVDDGWDPPQFKEAHRVRISNDGMAYVADGVNKRFQVFTIGGAFVDEVYVERGLKPDSVIPDVTIAGTNFEIDWAESYRAVAREQLIDHHETSNVIALSSDAEQRFLYIHERSTSKVWIYDRESLTKIGELGDGPGRAPGQFYVLHDMKVDSQGSIYTVEVSVGARVQKFVLKGYMTPLGT